MKKMNLLMTTFLIYCPIFSNNFHEMKEIPKYKNAVKISHTIIVPFRANEIYNFLVNDFSDVYSLTSEGHEYFKIRGGGEMKTGSIIDCAETADNQSILHEYIVEEMIANKRIFYYSKPTCAKTQLKRRVIEGESNTYVYWDLKQLHNGATSVTLTIIIQFRNGFEKFFINSVVNGLKPWKEHCVEEMEGFKSVLINQKSTISGKINSNN